jgi:hypothetical protein
LARKEIGSRWDRTNRNAINDNFKEVYGLKDVADSAKADSEKALRSANYAKTKAESVQAQFNQVVIEGDSSVEAAQARVGADGTVYETLKERLDSELTHTNQLFETTNDRIDQTNEAIKDREVRDKLFKKSIFKQIPFKFPHYETIVEQEENSFIYPQSFTIDWENNEIFILYEPSLNGSDKRWVVVYDLDTVQYKTVFNAGNAGGEGIVVKNEQGVRYLYVKTTGTLLGKFNIDELPDPLSEITPVSEFDVGLSFNFSYRDGVWLIEQAVPSNKRTLLVYYDDEFNPIGSISVIPEYTGYVNSTYIDYIPKRQGLALGDGVIYTSVGGSYRPDLSDIPTPYTYYGVKILGTSGELLQEAVLNPKKLIDRLNNLGFYADRTENEGIHVAPNGDVYSLLVHVLTSDPEITENQGIIIFKEFSDEEDALNFKEEAQLYPMMKRSYIESGTYPIGSDRVLYDPYLRTPLNTLDEILDFMAGTELKRFAVYSNELSTPITDINGDEIPPSTFVEIKNTNNYTFVVEYHNRTAPRKYLVWGNSGSRTQRLFQQQYWQITGETGYSIYNYGTDLNDIKLSGEFYMDSAAPNNPSNSYGFLKVMGSVYTVVQLFYPVNDAGVYYQRVFNNNAWSAWRQFKSTN